MYFNFFIVQILCVRFCMRLVFGLGQKYCIVIKYATASAIIIIIILAHSRSVIANKSQRHTRFRRERVCEYIINKPIQHCDMENYLDIYTYLLLQRYRTVAEKKRDRVTGEERPLRDSIVDRLSRFIVGSIWTVSDVRGCVKDDG